ncbi:MAG: glutamate 5-kinase [Anaerolineaceae bacterium]|nr:glutamate 5-kinase [Anaerolineaceae bacterium]|tara:strand:- start:4782 stop:5909 length:1128 start_codon:yes stop_codon:yes gene_type:complete
MTVYKYQRLVVKLGTSTLTAGTPHLSEDTLANLVSQIAALCDSRCEVILVSSGAMAAGREALSFPKLPKEIPAKQMLSAVGQPRLMAIYEKLFAHHNRTVAQVLLTRQDLTQRRSYLNSRNTLLALLNQKVLPIVNENDAVTTEEIRVGDNDNLSALVANLVDADLLLMLTDQPGVFTADPRTDPNAKLLTKITNSEIPEELWKSASASKDELGTGGMITKLQAADLARRSGTNVVIASGTETDAILRTAKGESIGTHFKATVSTLESRKRFILSGTVSTGKIQIDDGATNALQNGSSLLPVGVASILGEFDRGDTVTVIDVNSNEIARGLTNYHSAELSKIAGRQSKDIESILGYYYGEEVIHRDQLVLIHAPN